MKNNSKVLANLQKRLKIYYALYQNDEMNEKEYLINAKDIDTEIHHMEMGFFKKYSMPDMSCQTHNLNENTFQMT